MKDRVALIVLAATAAAIVGAYLFFTVSNSSYTFGCDYLAYDVAARAWLAGGTPYDLSVTVTGDCGTYQYPPTFLLLVAPLTVLPAGIATWAWIALSIGCVVAAIAILPVPAIVRVITFMLAGTSWPMLFSIKVGATGPLLLLVFAIAWRWRDRPPVLAIATALGGLTKLQPALLVAWMALTGRWRALLLTGLLAGIVAGATFVADPGLWRDFLTVVRNLQGSAIGVGANFAAAAQALRAGLPEPAAQAVGVAHTAAVLLIVVLAARQATAEASILVVAVASQVVAPVMWDHYAAILFLPMAWLLARGFRPALVIGIALNAMLVAVVPPIAYLVVIDGTLLATWLVGRRAASRAAAQSVEPE